MIIKKKVSRCGMVYLSSDAIGYLHAVKSWVSSKEYLPNDVDHDLQEKKCTIREYIWSLFESKLPPGLEFVRTHCKYAIDVVDCNLSASCCRIFQSLFTVTQGVDFSVKKKKNEKI